MVGGQMVAALAALAFLPAAAAALPEPRLGEPERVTGEGERYRLSRAAQGSAAFDDDGRLHLTYWSGGEVTTAADPSFVYYRNWTRQGGWSPELLIDESEDGGGNRIGGRNPALAVHEASGLVYVAWQDHRHGSASQAYIDNIELYGRLLRPDGPAAEDRLTTTNAPHNGDNAYAPKLAITPRGELALAWHDFHLQPGVSDIYLRLSTPDWEFPDGIPITDHLMTDLDNRGGAPAYTLPSIAVAGNEDVHLCWISGTGADGAVYYGTLAPGTGSLDYTEVFPDGGDFFAPPQVILSPQGAAWIVAARGGQVTLNHVLPGASAPAGTIIPFPSGNQQSMPSARFDEDGVLHLAWTEDSGGRHVHYGLYDIAGQASAASVRVTRQAGNYGRPLPMPGMDGAPHLLFDEQTGFASGTVWFAGPELSTSVPAAGWTAYE